MLERLLRGRRNVEFVFFSDNYLMWPEPISQTMGRYHLLSFQRFGLTMRELPGPLGRLNVRLGMLGPVRRRAEEIVAALTNSPPSVMIGCSGNPYDLSAAALAADKLGASFVAYLFDDPIYQNPVGQARELARKLERMWSHKAAEIICPNERLGAVIHLRTGRACAIIRNPAGNAEKQNPPFVTSSALPMRIVYSGSIYNAQADSLMRLATVVNRNPEKFRLEVYSPQSERTMADLGIRGSAVSHFSHVGDDLIAPIHSQADFLYLPLGFADDIRPIVETSSPGKIGDYLISDVPILVHAPANSYVTDFFRRHDAGLVVDHPSVEALEQGVRVLAENRSQSARFKINALQAAQQFDASRVRSEFWRLIEPIMIMPRRGREKKSGILLVGRIDDARFIRWANSLENSPWAVKIFSTQPEVSGSANAGLPVRMSLAPGVVDASNDVSFEALKWPQRLVRATRLGVFDLNWAIRRIIHGPLASLGGRGSARSLDLTALRRQSDTLFDSHRPGEDSVTQNVDQTELAADLARTIEEFEPQIIHLMDEASCSLVSLVKARAVDRSAKWLTSSWGLPPASSRAVLTGADRFLGSPAAAKNDGDVTADFIDGAGRRDREEGPSGLSKLMRLTPRQVRQMSRRFYSRLFSKLEG